MKLKSRAKTSTEKKTTANRVAIKKVATKKVTTEKATTEKVATKKVATKKSVAKKAFGKQQARHVQAAGDQALRIAIIGTGRLGTALALALSDKGFNVTALVARNKSHAARARGLMNQTPPATTSSPLPPPPHYQHHRRVVFATHELDKVPPCDVYFIATPDDAILQAAQKLAAVFQTQTTDSSHHKLTVKDLSPDKPLSPVALHLSGARASDELNVLRAQGFAVASMHPLISVNQAARAGAAALSQAYFALEGDRRAVKFARRLVERFGARWFEVNAQHKALYHAAAVITSGHLVALFSLAIELLAHCGIDAVNAQKILLPLLNSTTENLSKKSSAAALTGSFARADLATIKRHLAALNNLSNDSSLNDAPEIYALLGLRALRLAAANFNPEQTETATKIIEILNRRTR